MVPEEGLPCAVAPLRRGNGDTGERSQSLSELPALIKRRQNALWGNVSSWPADRFTRGGEGGTGDDNHNQEEGQRTNSQVDHCWLCMRCSSMSLTFFSLPSTASFSGCNCRARSHASWASRNSLRSK